MLPVVRAVRLTAVSATADDIKGRVLVHDVSHELRKGSVLRPEDLEAVRRASEIHVVELEPGDVHEDVAAKRLAAALAGPGLEARPPVQSQARLIATLRGLGRGRGGRNDSITELGRGAVFSGMD